MENEKKNDYWQVLFTASALGVVPYAVNQVKNVLPFSINGIVLAAIIGALGALIACGIYNLVKTKKPVFKIIAYIGLILVVMGSLAIVEIFSSDAHIVKKDWNVIKNGNLSFEYPYQFSEMQIEPTAGVKELKAFNVEREDRFAYNMIINFEEEAPAPEDSLSGSIFSSLSYINATEIEWYDSEFYANAVTTKVKYKIGKNERIGFGIIYFNKATYELATFLPYSKNYSEDFLNRIISSISIEE